MAKDKEYMRNYMREYSAKRRLKALEYLGGVCVDCGLKDGLEIHHIDPETKSFTLASGWHHAWDKIVVELQKCEVLCDSCHKNRHKVVHQHGDVRKYWQGCKCASCKLAFAQYHKAWKQSKNK